MDSQPAASTVHIQRLSVPPSAIDALGHVNNQEYLRWMQEVAIAHSAARGWPMERYLAIGAGWVVRSHFIEYLRPAFAGDAVRVTTWVADVKRRSSTRKYRFTREADAQELVRAETLWVFVDIATGTPREIPEEMKTGFLIATDGVEAPRAG